MITCTFRFNYPVEPATGSLFRPRNRSRDVCATVVGDTRDSWGRVRDTLILSVEFLFVGLCFRGRSFWKWVSVRAHRGSFCRPKCTPGPKKRDSTPLVPHCARDDGSLPSPSHFRRPGRGVSGVCGVKVVRGGRGWVLRKVRSEGVVSDVGFEEKTGLSSLSSLLPLFSDINRPSDSVFPTPPSVSGSGCPRTSEPPPSRYL